MLSALNKVYAHKEKIGGHYVIVADDKSEDVALNPDRVRAIIDHAKGRGEKSAASETPDIVVAGKAESIVRLSPVMIISAALSAMKMNENADAIAIRSHSTVRDAENKRTSFWVVEMRGGGDNYILIRGATENEAHFLPGYPNRSETDHVIGFAKY
jgi:hypothetical protein